MTIKNILLNKKRAIGTTVGIILSVALICAVGGMFTSFQKTLVEEEVKTNGHYHLEMDGIDDLEYKKIKLHKNVEAVDTIYMLGWSHYESLENSEYIKVFSTDKIDFDNLAFKVEEGSFPKNDNEIIVSDIFLTDTGLNVGDSITLNIGSRVTDDGFTLTERNPYSEDNREYIKDPINKTYKIVGVASRNSWSYSYFGITTSEINNDNIKAYITLKNPKEYKDTFQDLVSVNEYNKIAQKCIDEGKFCSSNHELLRWEILEFSDDMTGTLMTIVIVVIAIILVTSIFCIRNSFAISTTEKMKMYGMLASIGATKKQIKRSVITEGLMLGLIGIPIGVLSGIFAVFVIIKVINTISQGVIFMGDQTLVFSVSIIPILAATILGFVVIYASAISSARRASKVSPIDNLRNSNDIKLNSKKLSSPKIIEKLFGTGGVLAYKNLKRSKKKYRTTIVSLTVSIFVFISMYAFINEGLMASTNYYTDYPYNVIVYLPGNDSIPMGDLDKVRKNKNTDASYLRYSTTNYITINDLSKVNQYKDEIKDYDEKTGISIAPIAFDTASFKEYAKKIGVKYEDVKGKAVIYNKYAYSTNSGNTAMNERYNYKSGDKLVGTYNIADENGETSENKNPIEVEIGAVTMIEPYGLERTYYSGGYLIFEIESAPNLDFFTDMLYIDSPDASKLVKEIKEINESITARNLEEQVEAERAVVLIVEIFLYGFISVITLIGVTNIFNTITSNMELRSKDFAILKSIGMTKREFMRMINLETLFYSTKSLIYGTILGIGGSVLIHSAFNTDIIKPYSLPLTAIIISIIFVFIIVYLIMKYSILKINKQNTIETIRNENI